MDEGKGRHRQADSYDKVNQEKEGKKIKRKCQV